MKMVRVTTRHPEDFDLLSQDIDPARSLYAIHNVEYASKIKAFYSTLDVPAAIWSAPEDQPMEYVEPGKTIEYLLTVEENRIIAYVDECTWSHFLSGQRSAFSYSRTAVRYDVTSVLVAVPIKPEEIREVRQLFGDETGHS